MRTFCAGACIAFMTIAALGRSRADWLATRRHEFADWTAIHPDITAQIARFKKATEQQISGGWAADQTSAFAILRVDGAPAQIWDLPEAPKLAVVPAGSFLMGSPVTESGRFPYEVQHRVTVKYPFAVGIYDVTRAEFAAFVAETNYDATSGGCYAYENGDFTKRADRNWQSPGFEQTDSDPVVCVSRVDAKAYIAWLARKTGKDYRLPSESEWEYAARAGSTTARPWGETLTHDDANYGKDQCCGPLAQGRDHWLYTSPTGSFLPNGFGLFDVLGNVWQLTEDCYVEDYHSTPVDGSPARRPDCKLFIARGSAWSGYQRYMRSALRNWGGPETRNSSLGFRVARSL